jgi:hypothetical protein
VSEERHGAHVDRENADGLLNARTDSSSGAFGTLGTEAGRDLNCFRRSTFDRFREAVRKSLREVTDRL